MADTPSIWKPQHQVNLTDIGDQQNPAVISIGGGRYLVAWTEATGGPIAVDAGSDIVGQIFDALGNPVGTEFKLNQSFFGNNELDVALAGRAGGGFVMVYVDDGGSDDIRIEHYDMDGIKIVGPPSTLADAAAGRDLDAPQITMAADGSHLVVYESDDGAGDVDILGKIVNPDGSLGAEFTIFSDGEDNLEPTVAALSNGNFVVAWENEYVVGTNTFINLRVITPGTPPTLGALTAPDVNLADQNDPKVAALTGGGFVVVYHDNASGDNDIRAAIYDNNGVIVTPAFTVNNDLTGNQNEPAVAALPDGGFVVIWDDDSPGGGVLIGQRFDAAGNQVGDEFFAGSIGSEDDIAITVLDDGRFIVGFEQTDPPDDDVWGTIFDPRQKTVTGTGEDDILTAFATGGTVKGKGGDDMLLGTSSGDNLKGGGGKDYLVGMDGNDEIKGGGKKDSIVFAFELDKNNNVDTVQDWKNDKLLLVDDLFPAVGDNVSKNELRFGITAQDGNDYLIAKVRASQGKVTLYYDADGQGGAGKVKFAVLEYKGGLDLDHKDFKVVADLDI